MLSQRFYKFFAIFLIVGFLIYIPVFALDRLIVNKPNHPVSLAIKDRFKQPEQWRPFTSQKGKFRVFIPGGYPKKSFKTIPTSGASLTLHSFSVSRDKSISYFVSYFDAKGFHIDPKIAMEAMIAEGIKGSKAKRLSSRDLHLGNVPGKEVYLRSFLSTDKEPLMLRQRIYVKQDRIYQLVITALESDKHQEESDKFMESFEIIN